MTRNKCIDIIIVLVQIVQLFKYDFIFKKGDWDMIKITNVTKSYGKKKVLENLNCTIKTGSIYVLVGANGAG